MKKHILGVIRSIAFLTILFSLLNYINNILTPKFLPRDNQWPTTQTFNQFYELDENSIDVLFLGSSVVVNGFSPQEIYNEYGITSYNLASKQQSVFLSYYWLKEALNYQKPKVVVLDDLFLYQRNPSYVINTGEGIMRECLDYMKWSDVKREAVSKLCEIDESQDLLSYYFPNFRYHSRWTELLEQDFVEDEAKYSDLKGFSPLSHYEYGDFTPFVPGDDTSSRRETMDLMQEYLDKMVELCKQEGITLVIVSVPEVSMSDAWNNTMVEYAKEKDIDYYNFSEKELYDSLDVELPKESVIYHSNVWGAIKLSRKMGEILKTEYNVPSKVDEQFESTKDEYEQVIKNCELPHIDSLEEYVKAIDDERYTVFITARDDASSGLNESQVKAMQELGLSFDLMGKYRWSYAAVISPESGVSEKLSDYYVSNLRGSIRGGKSFYSISSSGYWAGQDSSISIDGAEYCKNRIGLNFVVFDNELNKVVDSVAFDTYSDGAAYR